MTIAIIGGGVSGLALGNALVARGHDARVYEASPRPGGKVGTKATHGYLLETGPNGFLDNEPAMLELVEQVGLTPKLRRASNAAKRRFLFTRGALREVPASPAFLISNVLSLPGRLRLLAEPFSRRGPSEDESVSAFMRRHLGAEVTDVLIDAVQSGIYAGDPARLSANSAFPKLKELEREHRSLVVGMLRGRKARPSPSTLCSFEGGLETLTSALTGRLGERVECQTRVESLDPKGQGWTLRLHRNGSSRTVQVERVVLGVPAFAAASLVRPFAPEAAAGLEGIAYAPVAVVHLCFDAGAVATPPEGFGLLVPHREGRPTLGILFVSSFFPWRVPAGALLLTVMLGGARHPEVLALDAGALESLAQREVGAMLGISARPKFTDVVAWDRAIPQYEVGHSERLTRIESALARFPGLFLGGNAYRGIGLNDCVRNAKLLAAQLTS
jgi:oxygen-dependent protoporphyrinogen oxidase